MKNKRLTFGELNYKLIYTKSQPLYIECQEETLWLDDLTNNYVVLYIPYYVTLTDVIIRRMYRWIKWFLKWNDVQEDFEFWIGSYNFPWNDNVNTVKRFKEQCDYHDKMLAKIGQKKC